MGQKKIFLAAKDDDESFSKWYLLEGDNPELIESKEKWSGVDVDSYKTGEDSYSHNLTSKEASQIKMYNSYKRSSPKNFVGWLEEFSKSKTSAEFDNSKLEKYEADLEKKIALARATNIARIKKSK